MSNTKVRIVTDEKEYRQTADEYDRRQREWNERVKKEKQERAVTFIVPQNAEAAV